MVHITNQLFDKSRYCDFYDKYEFLQWVNPTYFRVCPSVHLKK